ncbi:MAG: 2-oxo acid dehydrogenase subunit E2 [Ruminococcaceae bacterium]|nr:2-oxo acid dehydrogenase subunit E2 [Oscillospiraceae bacterium]
MAEKILMLALSPTMETGVIARWNISEGDAVSSGDVLCEVETDKATMDYESPSDGVLLKIIMDAGSSASVCDVIAIVGKEGEDITALLDEVAAQTQEGQAQRDDESVPTTPQTAAKEVAEHKTQSTEPAEEGFIRSSPLARKLADMHDLDLGQVKGSGPAGRIIKADVEKAVAGKGKDAALSVRQTVTQSNEDIIVPLSNKRRVIASRLSDSKYSAPHYYLNILVEMDELMAARSRLNASAENKVSVNAFLIKYVAEALRRHSRVNASWQGDSIIEYGRVDIGLAVAQEDGLITPVVRDCTAKGIRQIDEELQVLIQKARKQTLTPEEYTGATFTISSLGSFGIESFTAIINPPCSAILAVGEIKKTPVVQPDDSLKIRQLMKMTLSCDHRVIDGAVGARFLADLRDIMQDPVRLLF